MKCNYAELVKMKRAKSRTQIKVSPTGTAVAGYQVNLGNRPSLRDVGVVGAPAWTAEQTETWVRTSVSATCPRRLVVFEGGKKDIDLCMEFGDDFDGALNTTRWTPGVTPTISNGVITGTFQGKVSFGAGYGAVARAKVPSVTGVYRLMGFGTTDSSNFYTFTTYNANPTAHWSFEANAPYVEVNGSILVDLNWHRFEIRRIGATVVKFYLDGSYLYELTSGPSGALPLANIYGGSGSASWDWGFVRKFVANEPIAGTAQPSALNRSMCQSISLADGLRACCA